MKIYLAKVSKAGKVGLVPTDEAGGALLRKLGDGEINEFTLVRPRSSQWNRLYWALCRTIGENQDPARDEDSIDAELRVLAGHYEAMMVRDPRSGLIYEVRVPKRIAFDKLTAEEWAEYWKKAEQAIIVRFGEEFIAEVSAA